MPLPNNRTSSDRIPYAAATTPVTLTFDDAHYRGVTQTPDGFRFHHFFVNCEKLRATGLPLDANPREPTRAQVVKDMAKTLSATPARFHHWNNGITVVCDELVHSSPHIALRFESGSGICNGGHTYFTIVTFPQVIDPQALVHIEAIELPHDMPAELRRIAINDIARYRNANRALAPTTQADFLGYYKPFQDALGSDAGAVRWHEGDSNAAADALPSETLIRMLAAMDPLWYWHPVHSPHKTNHQAAATGSMAIHNKWYENQEDLELNLRHMAFLTKDLFRISEMICHTILHGDMSNVPGNLRNTNFYREWLAKEGDKPLAYYRPGETGARLPNPALIMMLGAFRANVYLGKSAAGEVALIGLLDDPDKLWIATYAEYLGSLSSAYNDNDQNPSLFIKSGVPYDHQLLKLLYGMRLPDVPLWLIETGSGKRFERDADPKRATHHLLNSPGGYGELKPFSTPREKQKVAPETWFREVP
jgi:hypothetical protein